MLERRSVKRLRALVSVLTVAVVIAATLTAITVDRNTEAQRASRLATARELVSAATANLEVDRQLAILLALEAVRTTSDVDGTVLPQAEEILRRAAPAVAIDTTSILGTGIRTSTFTTDGGAVAIVGRDGSVGVWDLEDGSRSLGIRSPSGTTTSTGTDVSCGPSECPDVLNADLSENASVLATADGEGLVRVWSLDPAREILTVSNQNPYVRPPYFGVRAESQIALSPDGQLLATGGGAGLFGIVGTIRMWDIATRQRLWSVRAPRAAGMGFSPNGSHLFFGAYPSIDAGLSIVDVDVASGETTIVLSGRGVDLVSQFSADASAHEQQPPRGVGCDVEGTGLQRDHQTSGAGVEPGWPRGRHRRGAGAAPVGCGLARAAAHDRRSHSTHQDD
jgi:hypothetical protein